MIEIYCDGAYSSSRDIGGWAFVVINDNIKIHSQFFPIPKTTNNRMEIQAVIEACTWAIENNHLEITIYSDSMYVIGTMSKGWKRNKNHDLWEILDNLTERLSINWMHVKGHNGNKYNELCDALASTATYNE